jgi:hypothetical protein
VGLYHLASTGRTPTVSSSRSRGWSPPTCSPTTSR